MPTLSFPDHLITHLFFIVAGVACILVLAEVIINKSVKLAQHAGLSGSFIGLTILSIGTSIPEIMSHLVGSFEILRQPEMMQPLSGLLIGTNIGSDIFQQNFILPLVTLLGPIIVTRTRLHDVMIGLLGAIVLTWLVGIGGTISRLEGGVLLASYGGYLFYLYRRDYDLVEPERGVSRQAEGLGKPLLLIFICFVLMALITERVVLHSADLVERLPISPSFFGVIFLGIATSLPELTTSLLAMYRNKSDISVGIMLGSNITNPLFGIGAGALLSTYSVPAVSLRFDLPVNLVTALLLYWFLWRNRMLSRVPATTLIASFFLYIFLRWLFFPLDFILAG